MDSGEEFIRMPVSGQPVILTENKYVTWEVERVIIKSTEYGFLLSILKAWPYHLPALRSRTSHITFICFYFLKLQVWVMRVFPFQECCKGQKIIKSKFKTPCPKQIITRIGLNLSQTTSEHHPSSRAPTAASGT